ncbi:MAG: hypothetical protein IPM99_14315 [Rubrivivax sp.]|nr:hypothetical protein [Rubrivivax sp.]
MSSTGRAASPTHFVIAWRHGSPAMPVAVAAVGWVARQRLAWRVDRAIDLGAWRLAKGPVPLHGDVGELRIPRIDKNARA